MAIPFINDLSNLVPHFDPTPGFSATNVIKTQVHNLHNLFGSNKSPAPATKAASDNTNTVPSRSGSSSGPSSSAAATQAAKQAQAQALFNQQLGNIYSSSDLAGTTGAGDLRTSLNQYLDSLKANQVARDQQTVQNYLAKQQGVQGVNNFVGQGIRSAGVQLNNQNAGDSSAAGAIANAYGQVGRQQLSDVGGQFAQDQNKVQQGLQADQVALASKLRDLPQQQTDVVNNIVNQAQASLAQLNYSAAVNQISPVDANQVKQNIIGATMGKLQGLDQLLSSGGNQALTPINQSNAVQQAGQLFTQGVAPASSYNFDTNVPVQLQGTGATPAQLPIFSAPKSKDQTQPVGA